MTSTTTEGRSDGDGGEEADVEVRDAPAAGRYELEVDGEVAGHAGYRLDGDRLVVPHVEVDHHRRGQGLAARLMAASTSGKPILLDLDYSAGHGQGQTKASRQKQIANYLAFVLWQAGHPDFAR